MKLTLLALTWSVVLPFAALGAEKAPGTRPAININDRVGCSSLCVLKEPLETAMKSVAAMGFKNVDLPCFSWAPHVNVPALMKDFDAEASKIEAAVKSNGLKVTGLTWDSIEARPFDVYEAEFRALVKLAGRLKARVINLMAPGVKVDRQDAVRKLRTLQAIAKDGGIILTLETHVNQVTEQPSDAVWFCRQVPGLGLTLDPSHYYAGPNKGRPFDIVYPYVQGTGFRAGGMTWETIQSPWGEGPIDFLEIIRQLEKHGYKGYYVSEYLQRSEKVDAVTETKKYLQWARRVSAGQPQ